MSNPAPPENWSLTYETNPQVGDGVSQGDDWIRQLKLDIRKRLEVEHQFGSINGDDNGLLRVGSARCFVQAATPTVIELGDYNNTTGAAGTATLSANATNSSPAETVGLGRIWFKPDGSLSVYSNGAWVTAASLPRGAIAGLNVTSNPANTVTITTGQARVGTVADRSLANANLAASFFKGLNTTWVSGTGNGGRAAGVALAPNTWYHIILLAHPNGTVDFGFDINENAVNLLLDAAVSAAGFIWFRRIGSRRTDGSSVLIAPFQYGDDVLWQTPMPADSFISQPSGADLLATLTYVPPGVRTWALLQVVNNSSVDLIAFAHGEGAIGATPSYTAAPLTMADNVAQAALGAYRVLTNTARQILFRLGGDAINDLRIEVKGYEDARGRWD